MHLSEWVWGEEDSRHMLAPPPPTSCTGRKVEVCEGLAEMVMSMGELWSIRLENEVEDRSAR